MGPGKIERGFTPGTTGVLAVPGDRRCPTDRRSFSDSRGAGEGGGETGKQIYFQMISKCADVRGLIVDKNIDVEKIQ